MVEGSSGRVFYNTFTSFDIQVLHASPQVARIYVKALRSTYLTGLGRDHPFGWSPAQIPSQCAELPHWGPTSGVWRQSANVDGNPIGVCRIFPVLCDIVADP